MPEWTTTITIGGLPGTGTTTACRTLEKLSGLSYVYAGRLFRQRAEELGMSLERYGAYCEQRPEEDQKLDDQQVALLRGPPLVLEGRLSGYLAHREKLPAFKVWFVCDPYTRALRVMEREGGDAEARMEEMRRREDSEKKRYAQFYGFDIADLGPYDLILDTAPLSKEAVVDEVIRAYERFRPGKRWWQFWK